MRASKTEESLHLLLLLPRVLLLPAIVHTGQLLESSVCCKVVVCGGPCRYTSCWQFRRLNGLLLLAEARSHAGG